MNCLRQMKRKEQRWSDKSAKRHKHHYIKHCIVEIVSGNSSTFHDVVTRLLQYSIKALGAVY